MFLLSLTRSGNFDRPSRRRCSVTRSASPLTRGASHVSRLTWLACACWHRRMSAPRPADQRARRWRAQSAVARFFGPLYGASGGGQSRHGARFLQRRASHLCIEAWPSSGDNGAMKPLGAPEPDAVRATGKWRGTARRPRTAATCGQCAAPPGGRAHQWQYRSINRSHNRPELRPQMSLIVRGASSLGSSPERSAVSIRVTYCC